MLRLIKFFILLLVLSSFIQINLATSFDSSIENLRRHSRIYSQYRWTEPVSAANFTTSSKFSSVISQSSPAVVPIKAYSEIPVYTYNYVQGINGTYIEGSRIGTSTQRTSSGSGFFITSDGYILTNKHVVSDNDAVYKVTLSPTEELEAEVIYRDPNVDLAVIKVVGNNFPVIQLGDSSEITIGEDVITIGNALGRVTDSISEGKITSLSKDIVVGSRRNPTTLQGLIQSNGRLYPGDSGGPLLNLEGEVIGVNTASTVNSRWPTSYYIPANTAKEVINKAGVKII